MGHAKRTVAVVGRLRLYTRINRWRSRPVMLLMVLIAFTTGVGVDRVALNDAKSATAATMLTELPEFSILEQTYDAIRNNYVQSDDISDEELIYGASQGMVEAVGDTGHSTFLDPDEADLFESSLKGELIGVGIYVDQTGPLPVVIAPIDQSPAYEAGIKSGDVIIAIDGTLTADLDPEEWAARIRGDAGTGVALRIQRGDEQPFEIMLTRAEIRVHPVAWRMLPGNIAWVKLSEFSQGATGAMIQALTAARAEGAEGLILDLRNNPGGYVFEASGVGSQFLPDGSVLYQSQNKEGQVSKVTTGGDIGEWLDLPMVVLINEGSASASEIVSSSLRDNGRATLIGETTAGTGTVLEPFELSDGSVVQLGTELWLTAEGEQLWKRGVTPDKSIPLDEGTFPSLPIDFSGEVIPQAGFDAVSDTQLKAGYSEIEELVGA